MTGAGGGVGPAVAGWAGRHWSGRDPGRRPRRAWCESCDGSAQRSDRKSRARERAMGRALLVVDVQRGFLNPFTAHIPERVRRLIERGEHDPILFTRFVNEADGPYHRFLDWHECAGP